jgi:hypothetical protein
VRTQSIASGFAAEVPTLLQHHLDQLRNYSSISLEVIRERGYWSATDWQQLDGLLFKGSQKPLECFPALIIPQYDRNGDRIHCTLRWDNPRLDWNGRPVKYEQPAGVELRLDVPPRCVEGLKDVSRPVAWTEGSKKADALATRGFIAVSTPGVEGWRSPSAITDLWGLALKGRDVYCMYDSDLLLKPAVRRAVLALAKWMETKGAVVYVLDWRRVSEQVA